MSKQIQEAFIVDAIRTPVGKAPRGMYRNTRPDDLLVHVLQGLTQRHPQLDANEIGDVIIEFHAQPKRQDTGSAQRMIPRSRNPDAPSLK